VSPVRHELGFCISNFNPTARQAVGCSRAAYQRTDTMALAVRGTAQLRTFVRSAGATEHISGSPGE
jgi:hypothetical protein